METKSYRFEGIVTALSPISHMGDAVGGTVSILRREKMVQADGSVELIPVISGNSFRGQLRDCGMEYMLDVLGKPQLPLPAFYFLFSGGSLTKVGDQAVDIATARKLRQLIPLVGIFGGAVGNQILRGKLNNGPMTPICQETIHLLPEHIKNGETINSIYEYLDQLSFTRTDDFKNEHLRELVAPEFRLLETKVKAANGIDELAGEAGAAQQMRYGVEVFAAGTHFYHELSLHNVTELEFDAFLSALSRFSEKSHIGGKANVGFGKVSIKWNWGSIEPRLDRKIEESLALSSESAYVKHLLDNRSGILSTLEGLK